jgi:hypothetical protein
MPEPMSAVTMANTPGEPGAGVGAAHLVEPIAVMEYAKGIPLRVVDVRKLTGGMINFVYRVFLDRDIEETQQKTAILKYSAAYISSDPTIKLSAERQIFETRALKHIPWREFSYPSTLLDNEGSLCPTVTLPEVYFDDPKNNIIIMQDMAEAEGNWQPEQAVDSFQVFCEQFTKSERKSQTARVIGSMLGTFFAQLHDWGRRPDSHARAEELFGANDEVIKLIVGVHMTSILRNIKKAGYELSQEQRGVLVAIMKELEQSVYQQRDTVILADIR